MFCWCNPDRVRFLAIANSCVTRHLLRAIGAHEVLPCRGGNNCTLSAIVSAYPLTISEFEVTYLTPLTVTVDSCLGASDHLILYVPFSCITSRAILPPISVLGDQDY